LTDGFRDLSANTVGVKPVKFEVKVREGGFDAREDLTVKTCPEKMELHVFRASRMSKDRENSSHGASKVIGIKSHDNVDSKWPTGIPITKSWSLSEDRDISRWFSDNTEADSSRRGG